MPCRRRRRTHRFWLQKTWICGAQRVRITHSGSDPVGICNFGPPPPPIHLVRGPSRLDQNPGAGSYAAFAHCVDRAACQLDIVLAEFGIEVIETVPSRWCKDAVSPAFRLLQRALAADPAPAGPRKYIFVSETTLPVRPLMHIRRILLATETTNICTSKRELWPKAHAWQMQGTRLSLSLSLTVAVLAQAVVVLCFCRCRFTCVESHSFPHPSRLPRPCAQGHQEGSTCHEVHESGRPCVDEGCSCACKCGRAGVESVRGARGSRQPRERCGGRCRRRAS